MEVALKNCEKLTWSASGYKKKKVKRYFLKMKQSNQLT